MLIQRGDIIGGNLSSASVPLIYYIIQIISLLQSVKILLVPPKCKIIMVLYFFFSVILLLEYQTFLYCFLYSYRSWSALIYINRSSNKKMSLSLNLWGDSKKLLLLSPCRAKKSKNYMVSNREKKQWTTTKEIQKLITAVKSDNFCYYKDRRARFSTTWWNRKVWLLITIFVSLFSFSLPSFFRREKKRRMK